VTRSIGTSLILLANIKICWDKHSSLLCVAENDEEKSFLTSAPVGHHHRGGRSQEGGLCQLSQRKQPRFTSWTSGEGQDPDPGATTLSIATLVA